MHFLESNPCCQHNARPIDLQEHVGDIQLARFITHFFVVNVTKRKLVRPPLLVASHQTVYIGNECSTILSFPLPRSVGGEEMENGGWIVRKVIALVRLSYLK